MLSRITLINFKCFKRAVVDLDLFAALVGENDTGKSAFLEAIKLGSLLGERRYAALGDLPKWGLPLSLPVVWKGQPEGKLAVGIVGNSGEDSWVKCERVERKEQLRFSAQLTSDWSPPRERRDRAEAKHREALSAKAAELMRRALGRAEYYAFRAEDLRKPSAIEVPAGSFDAVGVGVQMERSGLGFPTFLEGLLRKDRRAFAEMEEDFQRRFPGYRIELPKTGKNNRIVFRTRDGQLLPSENVSDGAMLFLAFLAVTHQPDPPKVLMVEEPENGVHHARLRDIVDALRKLVETREVQVLLTTHSPYLLDLVPAEQVRVFHKDAKTGEVHVKALSEYPEVEQLKKHFMTGEIWTELSAQEQS
jgi:predicted ATPase